MATDPKTNQGQGTTQNPAQVGGQHAAQPESESAASVERYMKGIHFGEGVRRDQLIEHARKNEAPDNIIKILEQFEDKDYRSAADVAKEFGRVKSK